MTDANRAEIEQLMRESTRALFRPKSTEIGSDSEQKLYDPSASDSSPQAWILLCLPFQSIAQRVARDVSRLMAGKQPPWDYEMMRPYLVTMAESMKEEAERML